MSLRSFRGFLLTLFTLAACARATPTPPLTHIPVPLPSNINLDADTQALIARADRVAFIIPFSHWDTDWHDTFEVYSRRSNNNLVNAITMAKAEPRFRYAMEQVLFVRHFWDTHPEYRDDLKALVHNRQLTFAWAGITQPETSLTAPAVQVRNWQMGRDWIAETFGEAYVPHVAWQSDAFGNSAAFPQFLQQMDVPYLFIGRNQFRCDPDDQDCTPLPLLFHWKSPATEARVLAAYVFYSDAWGDIFRAGDDEAKQLDALRAYVARQFERTTSRYAFIPMGFDFLNPLPQLMSLVERNNADSKTVFVVSGPETAFQYIATQDLPEFEVDLNPIWQAFYGSRPFAKIADKESEYFLTANDKFGLLLSEAGGSDAPPSSAWLTATINAHYDNIGAVSFDWVWERTQRPRFEQAVTTAAADLAATLTRVASGIDAPLVIFNPTSWPRSEIVEINAPTGLPDLSGLPAPVQTLGPNHFAFRMDSVPPIGFAAPTGGSTALAHPATVSQANGLVTLSNGLVSVTLDPARGGAFSNLQSSGGPPLLNGLGDDVRYWADTGDIYGARFGEVVARARDAAAHVTVLAEGPLLARAQAAFSLGGQPVTKTVTLRANSPLVEVALEIKALPETSALVHMPTSLQSTARTDDLGFGAFTHEFDARPIASGDITYRRKIFYPTVYWTDVSDAYAGLTLITHGLQGVGGVNDLSMLLVRWVTDKDGEGLSDPDYHTLRYAYLPHVGLLSNLPELAYAFNQPLIPAWRSGDRICVQLPFRNESAICNPQSPIPNLPTSYSLLSASSGLVADLYRRGDHVEAIVLDYDPATPATLTIGDKQTVLDGAALTLVPIELTLPVAPK